MCKRQTASPRSIRTHLLVLQPEALDEEGHRRQQARGVLPPLARGALADGHADAQGQALCVAGVGVIDSNVGAMATMGAGIATHTYTSETRMHAHTHTLSLIRTWTCAGKKSKKRVQASRPPASNTARGCSPARSRMLCVCVGGGEWRLVCIIDMYE